MHYKTRLCCYFITLENCTTFKLTILVLFWYYSQKLFDFEVNEIYGIIIY